jgi:hypothetical protein
MVVEPPRAAVEAAVPAMRYRVWVVEGAMEMVHGGGAWIEELWFPEQGVVANVLWKTETVTKPDGSLDWATKPVMNAFKGKMRNKSNPDFHGEPIEQPTEKVLVPRDVAQRIFALAELTARQGETAQRMGADVAAGGLLRQVPFEGAATEPK